MSTPDFTSFGSLLKFLRKRARLTQRELGIRVSYDESIISRLERDQYPPPDTPALLARFVPELDIEDEPDLIERFLALAATARSVSANARESGTGNQPSAEIAEAGQTAPMMGPVDTAPAGSQSKITNLFRRPFHLPHMLLLGVGLVLAALLLWTLSSLLHPSGPSTRPLLKRGDSSQDVREAQHMLNQFHEQEIQAGRAGLEAAPLAEDGIFGPRTEQAVLSFQRMILDGLSHHTGVIGPLTWAELYKVRTSELGGGIRRHRGLICERHDHPNKQGATRIRVCAWSNVDYLQHQVSGYGYVELVAGPPVVTMSISSVSLQADAQTVLSQPSKSVDRKVVQEHTEAWNCKGAHKFRVEVIARVSYPDGEQPLYTTSSDIVETVC